MELRHLRYFVAVAEELNFRRAAERLNVTQPALSTQVKDLEEEIGVRLMDRDTGGVTLTEAGAAFLVEARLILVQTDRAVSLAREVARGQTGAITVGYVGPLLVGALPEALNGFKERFPSVEVTLKQLSAKDQMEAVEKGEIDVGFTIRQYLSASDAIDYALSACGKLGVVMHERHPLSKRRTLSLADLKAHTIVGLEVTKGVTAHADIMRELFRSRHLPSTIKSVDGAETFRALVESGTAVSLVTPMGSLARSQGLVYRALSDEGPDMTLEVYIAWRRGGTSKIAQNFVEEYLHAAETIGLSGIEKKKSRAKPIL
jgi:DNA-binding transcriptional LysR family regulator